MSQAELLISPHPGVVPTETATPKRAWYLLFSYLVIWFAFYLAEPLDLTFSSHELLSLDDTEVSNEERVERNIEHNESGNIGRQLGLLGLLAFGGWNLWIEQGKNFRVKGLLGLLIVLLLGWWALTVCWSDLPLVTVRKLIVLGCVCVAALGLARQYSSREVAGLIVFCATMLIVVGVGAEAVLGNFHPLHPGYRFSGLNWPAFSAWLLVLQVAAILHLRRHSEWRWLLDLLLAVTILLIMFTKTRAALGSLVIALLCHVLLTWSPRRLTLAAVLGGFVVSLGGLAGELFAGDVGKRFIDAINLGRTESAGDVSGRAGLWTELMGYVQRKPLGGYGYETFWTPARLFAVGQSNWGAPDAHNSFLNLTLGVGVVGSGFLVLVLITGIAEALVEFLRTKNLGYLLTLEALLILVVNGFFVSTAISPSIYSFVTLILLAQLGFVEDPSSQGDGSETLPAEPTS